MAILVLAAGFAAAPNAASAAPARLDPGDQIGCPVYQAADGRMVVDWQCLINTITYN